MMPGITYRGRGTGFKKHPGKKISTTENEPSKYIIDFPNFIVAICVVESISINIIDFLS